MLAVMEKELNEAEKTELTEKRIGIGKERRRKLRIKGMDLLG